MSGGHPVAIIVGKAIVGIGIGVIAFEGWHEATKDKGKGQDDKQKNGTPRSNQAQNKQVRDIATKYGLNKAQQRELHDEITGQNYSYKEIEEIAREIAGKGK
jgi:hypothetical protein